MKRSVTWGCIFAAGVALAPAASRAKTPPMSRLGRLALVELGDDERLVAACAQAATAPRMLRIEAGPYRPFYKQKVAAATRWVDAFLLDERPVTRGEYLAFVARRPAFRKSRIERLFAESAYLSDWRGDLDPGQAGVERPATLVSWFAAKAYCECHGKRLPTVIEWEWAAGGQTGSTAAEAAPFRFAMGKNTGSGTTLVFADVWEWTNDFNSVLISGRSDTGSGSTLFCGDGYRATDARDYAGFLRHSFRASLKAGYTLKNLGFRCARDLR